MMKTGCTGTERPTNGTGGPRRVVLALAVLLLTCVLTAGAVSAANVEVTTWDELKDNFTGGKTITLCDDVELEGVLTLDSGDLVLDLGSYTLSNITSSTPYPIQIDGGNLTITGSGTIEYPTDLIRLHNGTVTIESGTLVANEGGSVVVITGSPDPSAKRYSNLIVGKDAVLKGGWYVAFISYDSSGKNFGITMDISGQLISCENPAQGGALYINGQLQGEEIIENPPVITIHNTAVIAPSKGNAVYAAGYGKWIIKGGEFKGTEALSIKSGEWIIEDGTFTGNGPFFDPAESNGNGSEPTGAAVSVTTNHAYAKNVSLTITGGTFHSKNQSAFYEGGNSENTGTALKGVAISGGSFTTENTTLSAVTIHNSGDSEITNGISITDADRNNLLYRGVNLKDVAEWTGDATTGYTLVLDKQNAKYKLMDAFTTTGSGIQITADGVTLDGNGKKITAEGNTLTVVAGITEPVTIKNVVATISTSTANPILDSPINIKSPVVMENNQFDITKFNNEAGDTVAVILEAGAEGSTLKGTQITMGSADNTGVQGIAVYGNKVTISGSTITTTALQDDDKSTGIYTAGVGDITITDNTFVSKAENGAGNRGIMVSNPTANAGQSITITDNTFDLAAGAGDTAGAVVAVSSNDDSKNTVNLDVTKNTVTAAARGVYLVSDVTVTGDVAGNDFRAISEESRIATAEGVEPNVENLHTGNNDAPVDPQPVSGSSSGNMNNAYRVLFNDGSTTLSVQTDLSSGDKLTKPETPVKDGYTFAGWYKDSACTQAWDFETGIPGDMTLYAKWTATGSSGETEATTAPTATSTAVTTPQPTKTQSTTATTSAPQATTAAGVSPTLTQAPAPVAGALFGLLAAGVLLRRRFQ